MHNSRLLPAFKPTEWMKLFVSASIYALLLYLGDTFFESEAVVAHLELASGYALATLLIGGPRYAMAVLFGALLAHSAMGASYPEMAIIASSDALEAWLGYRLLMRGEKLDLRLQSLLDYLRLILVGGCVSIAVSAMSANLLLLAFGFLQPETIIREMLHWWMSDTLGVILMTPLLLVWWGSRLRREDARQMVEAVLLIGLTMLVGQIVFFDWLHDVLGGTPNGYWMFMLITWVAMFLGSRGTTIALVVVALQALFGAIQGVGYFAEDIERFGLISYWFYMLTLSLVGMSLATYVREISQANFALTHRDALIREIHHRIKNNIQGITGLLRQLADKHPAVREGIDETIGQMQSIASIHGLQERTALDEVDLADLVDAVASGVGSLWGRAIHVEVAPDCKPCVVDAAEAVPLALILNELLSNALKHGEPTDRVTLALVQGSAPGSVLVAIRNAGKLPSDFDFERNSGTGLQLVKSLMPGHGAKVFLAHQDHTVVASLELEPPAIILRT